jgi:gamma-glutamyltranspeptidase/glutathione hydrolase
MVASPDHLASEAGIALLRAGGSAADAAIAANAVLAVTCPHLCGLGGDLWALVHTGPEHPPAALNASGRSGSGADPDRLRAEGRTRMPFAGDIRSVPIPGCVDGWAQLHSTYGRAPWSEVLAPAFDLAAHGFPASPLLAWTLPLVADVEGADDLVLAGEARPGVTIRRPRLAATLAELSAGGRDGFYRGTFGRALLRLGRGEYAPDDLVTPMADWVDALHLDAWGHQLWTVPPNSQGYLTLASAWLAERLPLPDDTGDERWAHLLVEAARAAAADRLAVLHERGDGAALLAEARLAEQLARIDPERSWPGPSPTRPGDTAYLGAVDDERCAVSLIQSNANGFGAHLVVPDTGVFLHNRGIGFALEPGHPAEYGPLRRPPSTLSPLLVTGSDGSLHSILGTMGGDGQPQILLQLLVRMLAHGQSPGHAVGAPRFVLGAQGGRGFDTWEHPHEVRVEADAPAAWATGLRSRGHLVRVVGTLDSGCGHAHAIRVELQDDGSSVLAGAADPRALIGSASGY